jgi:hypothetical protein
MVHPIRSFGSLQELEKRLGMIAALDTLEIVDWQSPMATIEARSLASKSQLIEALIQQIPNGQITKNVHDEVEMELSQYVGA